MAVTCAYHKRVDAVGACVNCGKLVCDECKVTIKGKIYCNPCVEELFAERAPVAVSSSAPTAAATVESTPAKRPAKPTDRGRGKAAVATAANTSGKGKDAAIPEEIRGWNWGAFLLNWIWGIGNKVWISLLCFVPFVNLIWPFVLGAKGNEWAWQSKAWNSIEHFKKTQRKWTWVGICLLCVSLVIGVALAIAISALYSSGGRIEFQ
jgi:hypothetical protein